MTFVCDFCSQEVKLRDNRCPNCGVLFLNIRCPNCHYHGDPREFHHGCPICHSDSKMFITNKPKTKPIFNVVLQITLFFVAVGLMILVFYGYM